MGSRESRGRGAKKGEAERYRAAAYAALGQLEWCINYLRSIRKGGIAEALDRNKRTIIERHRLSR